MSVWSFFILVSGGILPHQKQFIQNPSTSARENFAGCSSFPRRLVEVVFLGSKVFADSHHPPSSIPN
jgi:hypothetical protein